MLHKYNGIEPCSLASPAQVLTGPATMAQGLWSDHCRRHALYLDEYNLTSNTNRRKTTTNSLRGLIGLLALRERPSTGGGQ
jgi:hypothetical protein